MKHIETRDDKAGNGFEISIPDVMWFNVYVAPNRILKKDKLGDESGVEYCEDFSVYWDTRRTMFFPA